jgi:hypothetical protein
MKITTTHTRTETKEIEISFPSFTRVVDKYSTQFYFIRNEKEVLKVEEYVSGKIVNFSQWAITSDAFATGFVFITKKEFFEYYNQVVNTLYDDMEKLENELCEDDRTEFEIEQDRKESIEDEKVNEYCDNRD